MPLPPNPVTLADIALAHQADVARAMFAVEDAERLLRYARARSEAPAGLTDMIEDIQAARVEDAKADLVRLKRLIGDEILRYMRDCTTAP